MTIVLPVSEPPILLDVIFSLEGSKNINDEQFEKMKEFVKNSISKYEISENGLHVGIIEYSDEADLKIPLSSFYEENALNSAISKISKSNGAGSQTDKVLRMSAKEAFHWRNGGRPSAQRKLVILTGSTSTGTEPLNEAVMAAIDEGIQVYILGVGNDIDRNELSGVVDPNGDRLITVPNAHYLVSVIDRLKKKIVDDGKTGMTVMRMYDTSDE